MFRLWAVKYPCPVEPGAMLSVCGCGFGGQREDGTWKADVGRDGNVRKWEGLGGLMGHDHVESGYGVSVHCR